MTGKIMCINDVESFVKFSVHRTTLTMNIKKYLALRGWEKVFLNILEESDNKNLENTAIIDMPNASEKTDDLNEDEENSNNNLKSIEFIILYIMVILLIIIIIIQLYVFKFIVMK